MERNLPKNILADTLWFQNKLDLSKFKKYVDLRKSQGFSAIQICVGVPPEVGPDHKYAQIDLKDAAKKIDYLNKVGMFAIAYGAWGHQIEWLGVEGMKKQWSEIVECLDSKNVAYCLTGESNIWIGQENVLLPDKSTDSVRPMPNILSRILHPIKLRQRKEKWSQVLSHLHSITQKPIIIHVLGGEYSYEAVNNPELLSAVTVQTGHSYVSDEKIRRIIDRGKSKYPDLPFLVLEHQYEGIHAQFGHKQQVHNYKLINDLTGNFFYGAQGIWNVGDGKFLSHWGKQTFDQALKLKSPF